MQNAVFQLYRNLPCTYRFTNRNHSSQLFSPACFKLFRQNVLELSSLRLGSEERTFLTRLGFLPEDYLDWLEDLRLRPEEQVEMRWIKDEERSKEEGKEVGVIEVDIKGLWVECILYEVPIMAIRESRSVSHPHFQLSHTGESESMADMKSYRLVLQYRNHIFS